MSQAILDEAVQVTPASEFELPACRSLLPEALRWDVSPDFLLASTKKPLRIQGAAAFTTGHRRGDGQRLVRFAARVATPYRGRGIGTQLLNGVEAAARRRGIKLLSSTVVRRVHDDWADFLVHHGFVSVERQHTFEVDLGRMAEFYLPRRDWLVERKEIPAAVSVVSLREAPMRELAELFACHLSSTDEIYNGILRTRTEVGSDNLGFALMIGGEVQAAILHRVETSVAFTDALVVAPSLRGDAAKVGWANILLSARAIHWYLDRDVRRVRYVVSASNVRAMRQYSRFKPDELEVRETFEKKSLNQSTIQARKTH